LDRINDAKKFLRITSSGRRIINNSANDLFGVDEEDGTDGQGHPLRVDVGGILIIDHVVQIGDFARLVGDDGEFDRAIADFDDILDPFVMGFEGVGTQAEDLDVAFVKLRLEVSDCSELKGTH
jgi:hypothetical protein